MIILSDNDYIGIKYKRLGDTHQGADCVGLVRLYYREHGWPERFLDGEPILPSQSKASHMKRVVRYLRKTFDETKNPAELEHGDVMLFMVNGDLHLGLMLGYGDILSTQIPSIEDISLSTIYRRRWWMPFFRRGFKRRRDG